MSGGERASVLRSELDEAVRQLAALPVSYGE